MNIEEAIEILKEFKKIGFHTLMIKYNEDRIHTNKIIEEAIETLLTAYEKEKEKNKELEQENREIREWKYVIDNPIDLKKLSELDLIKIFGKSYIAVDKIKEKIKELEKEQEDNRKVLYNAVNNLCFKEIDKISNRISVNMSIRDILQSLF